MNTILAERLRQELYLRQQKGNLRTLSLPVRGIDFFSNDYLGISSNLQIIDLVNNSYQTISHTNKLGATGSRLLSGNSNYASSLENYLASFFQAETALLFNSGYVANLSVIATLPTRHDTILYDELAHACMKEGVRLSIARKRYGFRHNDMQDLEQKLRKATGTPFIIVESVYSMDGDFCPLVDLVRLAKQYNACIILDEAHSTGIYGQHGNGLACHLGLDSQIDIRIHTFGKAIGAHGAVVVGSKVLSEYLINFARGFIYTTAMPLHNLVTIQTVFCWLQVNQDVIRSLHEKIIFWKDMIQKYQLIGATNNHSPIQAYYIKGNVACRQKANLLQQAGFIAKPILSPTVREGSERIRICLHTFNTVGEIEKLCELLKN